MSTATDHGHPGDLPDDPTAATDWRGVGDDGTTGDGDVQPGGLRLAGGSRDLIRELARPHRRRLILAGLVIGLDQAVSVAGPLLIAYGIDTAVPAFVAGDRGPLFLAVGLYLLTALASALTRLVFVRMSGRISQDVLRGLRARVFDHAQQLSVSFHEKYTSGRVISRMTSDLETIGETLETGINDLIAGLLSVVVISGVLLWLDPKLGAVALLAFLPLSFVTRWFQRRSLSIYRGSRTAMASLIVQFTETMNGLRAVQTFRREPRNARIFAEDNNRFARNDGDALVVAGVYSPTVRLIGNVALTAVMILGAIDVVNGSIEVGILAAFLLYLRRMYDPMDELAMFYNQAQSAAAALEKIATLLGQRPSVQEPGHPTPLAEPAGELRFESVGFGYSAEREVLPRFDLTVPAGQTIALVGATGAGKTTLARLLARFYDPTEGRVLLDGVDLRELANDDLRRALVMVTQESFLFSGSVADNIALGKPTASRAEIEEAAAAVGVADFVNALPQGYDTDVRKRGGRLSAGQRQLVAFARAFLADPAVLILDEATASLDIPSEQAVQAALHRVLHGRTAVIIAHRLSTVSIADRVLVMDHGRIVEDGSPAELIAGQGRFAQLDTAWRESLA
ncbi:MAG: ABC transporter ATP-binding protein [Nakamurella sp.]